MQSLLCYAAEEHAERLLEVSAGHGNDVRRSWCDPNDYNEIVGCDVGGGHFHFHKLRKGEDAAKVPIAAARESLLSLRPGTLVVAERAHMAAPRTEKSLAQPWTEAELLTLYRDCRSAGIDILLFPHYCTTKARRWVAANAPDGFVEEEKTSDMNDARALAYFVQHKNSVALSKPPASFEKSPHRLFGQLVIEEANRVLNAERRRDYDGVLFPWVADLAEHLLRNTPPGVAFISNRMAAFSVASLICGQVDDRPIRFICRGRAPGFWSWLRHCVRSSSLHYRGGIARSNLFYHRFRAFLGEYGTSLGVKLRDGAKVVPFHGHTDEQEAVKVAAFREARKQLRDSYHIAADYCERFVPHELLAHTTP